MGFTQPSDYYGAFQVVLILKVARNREFVPSCLSTLLNQSTVQETH